MSDDLEWERWADTMRSKYYKALDDRDTAQRAVRSAFVVDGFDATRLGRELAKLETSDPAVKVAADNLREALSPHSQWLQAMVREVWRDGN